MALPSSVTNDIWIDINGLGNLIDDPWRVGGGCNEILYHRIGKEVLE